MYLVISTSLNPNSRSRILALAALAELQRLEANVKFLDLAETNLPFCDGADCYSATESVAATAAVNAAQGILLASPVYNYDLSASAKNLIEITGKAWTDKVVGFLLAAGGQGSFMAPMGLANSLMLDFRSFILPRFVYARGEDFSGDQISETDCEDRIAELAAQLLRITEAVSSTTEAKP